MGRRAGGTGKVWAGGGRGHEGEGRRAGGKEGEGKYGQKDRRESMGMRA